MLIFLNKQLYKSFIGGNKMNYCVNCDEECEEAMRICFSCGRKIEDDDKYHDRGNEVICDDCFTNAP